MKINCIIIDDDPLATKILTELIEKISFLNLISTYSSAKEVIFKKEEILKNVNLIFLDVEMPEMTGIEFLSYFEKHPYIIIVSSKENYALDAFEFEVTDYLTKPISLPRFLKAAERVNALMNQQEDSDQTSKDLFFKTDKGLMKINEGEILFIEALENYIKVFTDKKVYVVHHTLKSIIEKLPSSFFRVHRSYIINTKRVNQIQNNIIVIQLNGDRKEIPIGKSYQKDFYEKLNIL